MNKNSKIISAILIVIAIVVVIIISRSRNPVDDAVSGSNTDNSDNTPLVSETTKLSGNLSEYHNAELGFALKYPSEWEKEEGNAGVTLIIPIDMNQVSTVATLQTSIQVTSGICAFPPVTTIKDRSTVKVGANTFNMISMSNTVQGRTYFNRMYSLQQNDVCYMFSFASIALDPISKGLTGTNVTQAQNNNKAIVNTADSAFTDVVKSFTFVAGPQGQDESTVTPVK
ncbi:MAG: hypothetical protein WCO48_03240 [Candidatus Taylorbacteria bacterium]